MADWDQTTSRIASLVLPVLAFTAVGTGAAYTFGWGTDQIWHKKRKWVLIGGALVGLAAGTLFMRR